MRISDWSSDVCSSDLGMNVMKSIAADGKGVMRSRRNRPALVIIAVAFLAIVLFVVWSFWAELDQISRARGQVIPTGRVQVIRSEERRVGEECVSTCRSRWSSYH